MTRNNLKYTPEELAEFERCRQEIQALTQYYQGKKAHQNDKRIIADFIKWSDENFRKKLIQSHQTQECKKKIVDNNIKTWKEPEKRLKRLNGIRKAWDNPEILHNKTLRNKEVAQREGWKEKHEKTTVKAVIKPLKTPKGIFKSLTDAASEYGVPIATMQYWIKKSKCSEFYYLNPKESEKWKENNL